MGERGGALGSTLGGCDVAFDLAQPSLRDPALQQLQAADDAGQQIVEVVGQPARELAHRLHLLRLAQLLLGRGEGRGLLVLGGDVAAVRIDLPILEHGGPGNPAIAAVPAAHPVLERFDEGRAEYVGEGDRGASRVLGMHERAELAPDQVGLLPAEKGCPGPVHGVQGAVRAGDGEQVQRVPPQPVPLRRMPLDLLLQFRIRRAQPLLVALQLAIGAIPLDCQGRRLGDEGDRLDVVRGRRARGVVVTAKVPSTVPSAALIGVDQQARRPWASARSRKSVHNGSAAMSAA